MNFDKPFWKSVFREADGTASSSRLLTATIIVSSLLWVFYLTLAHRELPDLKSVGEFDCTTTLALYGINKVAYATASLFGAKDSPPA
jgi:hypothetical protein